MTLTVPAGYRRARQGVTQMAWVGGTRSRTATMRKSVRPRLTRPEPAIRAFSLGSPSVAALRRALCCLGFLALAACSMRFRLVPPYPTNFPVDQRVEVWRGTARVLLRGVTLDSATIRGDISPWRPRCNSCRVSIPRAAADSLVLVNSEPSTALGLSLALFVAFVLNNSWPLAACMD